MQLWIVRGVSPNGTPTTVVTCRSIEAVIASIERVHRADHARLQTCDVCAHCHATIATGRTCDCESVA